MPEVLVVSCQMNVHHYPWDEQICHIKFGSWSFDYGSLDMAVEMISEKKKKKKKKKWMLVILITTLRVGNGT